METKEKKNVEIESVNDKLYDDLFVQELEERLETDPLAANGLFNFFNLSSNANSASNLDWCIFYNCGED